MGGGASLLDFPSPSQEQLDGVVKEVLSYTYDRVHVRAHYAKVISNKEVDARLSFKVESETQADTPVLPPLTGVTSPPNEASFFARNTSNNPVWNQEELLLYQRETSRVYKSATAALDSATVSPTRVLLVRLEDVRDFKEKVLDHITTLAESTQKFILRNIERFMTDCDHKGSPLLDIAADDIDQKMPSTVEVIDETHRIPLPPPSVGWVHHKLEGEHTVVYISIKTSLAEDTLSSRGELEAIESLMVQTPLLNLSHGNKALLRNLQKPGNTRAILWIPGFNDSFHNHIFAEEMLENGYDIWILDLRRCGACRRTFPGGVEPFDYHHATDLREYFEEIERSMEIMKDRAPVYEAVVGYAHSTGALVMLDYALEFTDTQFSGFIFNSPFLDWGYAAGQMINLHSSGRKETGN